MFITSSSRQRFASGQAWSFKGVDNKLIEKWVPIETFASICCSGWVTNGGDMEVTMGLVYLLRPNAGEMRMYLG
jgi:hypothetical protein